MSDMVKSPTSSNSTLNIEMYSYNGSPSFCQTPTRHINILSYFLMLVKYVMNYYTKLVKDFIELSFKIAYQFQTAILNIMETELHIISLNSS